MHQKMPLSKLRERGNNESGKRLRQQDSPRMYTCGNRKSAKVACKDNDKRKSRCPCVIAGAGCNENCKCHNCGSIRQSKKPSSACGKEAMTRVRTTVSPYKRKKGTQFMKEQNVKEKKGPWKLIETLLLIICRDLLKLNNIVINSVTLHALYDFVYNTNLSKNINLPIAAKSTTQIAAKIQSLNG